MASILKHLRSSTADKRPVASGLADGQIAINTASGTPAMFFKDSNGGVVKVGPAHVGAAAPNAVPAGSAGNSLGELWVDNSLTTPGLNYYTGSAFVNLTPSGTTAAVGLVELATPAETQTGTDGVRAVTPSGLQSKVSDSTSTTSSTTIASSTAVKSAYDLANAALPKAGGTVTGELLIGTTGSLVFEGSSDDSFETTIAVTNPTADHTITFPNVTGAVVTTGDSGTVTSTMIANDTIVNADINSAAAIVDTKLATISTADKVSVSALNIDGATDIGGALENGDLFIVDDGAGGTNRKAPAFRMAQLTYSGVTGDITIASGGTSAIGAGVIVNADVNASAAIAHSKLANITAGSVLLGNATNVPTATALTGDVTVNSSGVTAISSGVIVNADVNASAAIAGTKISPDFGSQTITTTGVVSAALGAAATPSITFTGDLNTGIYSPGADQVAISTNGTGRLFVDASGQVHGTSYLDAGNVNSLVIRQGPGSTNAAALIESITSSSGERFALAFRAGATAGNASGSIVGSLSHTNTLFNYTIAGAHVFNTAGSERLRITSDGKVGLGTSSPVAGLQIGAYGTQLRAGSNTYMVPSGNSFCAFNVVAGQDNWIGSNAGGYNQTSGSFNILLAAGHRDANEPAGSFIGSTRTAAATHETIQIGHMIGGATAGANSTKVPRLTINSSGNVGIGTTGPSTTLHLDGSVADAQKLRISRGAGTTNYLELGIAAGASTITANGVTGTNAALIFQRDSNTGTPTESARIDASGRLLVGTSTARAIGTGNFHIQSEGTGAEVGISTTRNSNNTAGSNIRLVKTRGSTVGSATIVNNGDGLGAIGWWGTDGTNAIEAANITAVVDGTPGANDMPGSLLFSTATDASPSVLTERMRITNAGDALIGGTLPSAPNISLSAAGNITAVGSLLASGVISSFSFSYTSGTQTVRALNVGEMWLFVSQLTSYGAGDDRHGSLYLAGRCNNNTFGTLIAALDATGSFSISGNNVQYNGGSGAPSTTIRAIRLT